MSSARSATASPILYWIANLYVMLIVLVVGGMGLHNVLDFLKKVRRKMAVQKGLILEEPVPHRLYLRMTVNERLQHAGLALSFALLVHHRLHAPLSGGVVGGGHPPRQRPGLPVCAA